MLFKNIDPRSVLNAINRLENGKASDSGEVMVTVIKDAVIYIAYSLVLIYDSSLLNDFFQIFGTFVGSTLCTNRFQNKSKQL